jgi:hypothetical protein
MSRRLTPSLLVLLALALLALPAAAESFHVTLTDGTTFETRYQPQEASWDASMVLLLTEVGNWIGLPKDAIASVVADMGETGFGTRINSTTISLGPAPNDAAIPEEEEVAAGRAAGPAAARNAQEQLLESYMQQRQAEQSYSIQQFVEPNQTQGIPSRFVGSPTGGSRPFP